MDGGGFTGWVGELARAHTRHLASLAAKQGLTSVDALDAVQEAFHTFLGMPQARSLSTDRDDSLRLLTVLVRNAARNMRRLRHRSWPHVDADTAPLADAGPSVDALIDRAEQHVRLLGCIDTLGEIQRNVVSLRMLQELSGDAVASELGVSANHVAVLLLRAKRALADCIAEG